jgi:uncharacterized oxidoreductase
MIEVSTAKVLITGGSNGIGAKLAEHFLKAGAEVLVTGRDAKKLEDLHLKNAKLLTFQSDISKVQDRINSANHIGKTNRDRYTTLWTNSFDILIMPYHDRK